MSSRPARRRRRAVLCAPLVVALAAALAPAQEPAPAPAPEAAPATDRQSAPVAAAADAEGGAGAQGRANAGGDAQRRGRPRRPVPGTTVLALDADRKIELRFDQPTIDDPAYAAIQSPVDGKVVQFVKGRPLKLKTPVDLRFGDVVIEAGNHVPDYPGVYGLWLKNVGGEWRLVFNDYADVWGTQHDPAADAAEVPLALATAAEAVESFTAKLEPAPGGGVLRLAWGTAEWSAAFTFQ